ncbi:MAG: M48 family metallopeptidase [Saprospiraceae bacterium]|nr:M48 family metallopeptidase [Saprospiraceae bacterium]
MILVGQPTFRSCSEDRNLNFSVRLFFAPPDVRDYVIVHELAHLPEMNHSPKFWNIVEKIMPDYECSVQIIS